MESREVRWEKEKAKIKSREGEAETWLKEETKVNEEG